jgi:Fe-S-cluster formation regulator IscX/YfhJ
MGEQKTPGSLVSACETFKFLDLLYNSNGEDSEEDNPSEEASSKERANRKKATPSKKQIRREIKSIIDAKGDEEGWTDLSVIGNLLSQRVPGFDPRNYRFNKLGKMIESYNDFEMKKLVNEKNELIQFYFRVKEDPSQKKRTSVEILTSE